MNNKRKSNFCSGTIKFSKENLTVEYNNEHERIYLEMIKNDPSVIDVQRMEPIWEISIGKNELHEMLPNFLVVRSDSTEGIVVSQKSELEVEDLMDMELIRDFLHSKNYDVVLVMPAESKDEKAIFDQINSFRKIPGKKIIIH